MGRPKDAGGKHPGVVKCVGSQFCQLEIGQTAMNLPIGIPLTAHAGDRDYYGTIHHSI